jgi:hypothetical protein
MRLIRPARYARDTCGVLQNTKESSHNHRGLLGMPEAVPEQW